MREFFTINESNIQARINYATSITMIMSFWIWNWISEAFFACHFLVYTNYTQSMKLGYSRNDSHLGGAPTE